MVIEPGYLIAGVALGAPSSPSIKPALRSRNLSSIFSTNASRPMRICARQLARSLGAGASPMLIYSRIYPTRKPRISYSARAFGNTLILTSKFWRTSFEQRRCLVPASSYCEPGSGKPARWHWFAVNGDENRRLFAFPGIWQRWNGPVKKYGPNAELDLYSFMTTPPNALTDSINHERMPVLLSEDADFETWLSGSPSEAFALARSFDPSAMRIAQSGMDKEDLLGSPSAAEPSLL